MTLNLKVLEYVYIDLRYHQAISSTIFVCKKLVFIHVLSFAEFISNNFKTI